MIRIKVEELGQDKCANFSYISSIPIEENMNSAEICSRVVSVIGATVSSLDIEEIRTFTYKAKRSPHIKKRR